MQLTCLKLTNDHILITGDKTGTIKAWDVSDGEFRLLNAIKVRLFNLFKNLLQMFQLTRGQIYSLASSSEWICLFDCFS